MIHSPGAVKIGNQGLGWGSWEVLREKPTLGEPAGGLGLPACGADPFPGGDTRTPEGLKCLKPKVPTATKCSLELGASAQGSQVSRDRAIPRAATANNTELHLHLLPEDGNSPVLTCATGETGQVCALQEIHSPSSPCSPKPWLLHAGARPTGSSHRLCTGTMPFQTPFPGAGSQLPIPPAMDRARDRARDCARDCRTRQRCCVSPSAPALGTRGHLV